MSQDVISLHRRHERMKTSRMSSVETTWRDGLELSFPIRAAGLAGGANTVTSASTRQSELLDSTAADSAQILAANIMAGMTPANALWYGLDVGNETDEERLWLDEAAKLLWENIHASNFDAEGYEGCLDLVCAGQFALYIDDDREKGGLIFHLWPLAQVFCASTRADGAVDIVHREFPLTAEQACKEYGEENVSKEIREACEKGQLDQEFTFVQAIYPRTPHAVGARLAKNLPDRLGALRGRHPAPGSRVGLSRDAGHRAALDARAWHGLRRRPDLPGDAGYPQRQRSQGARARRRRRRRVGHVARHRRRRAQPADGEVRPAQDHHCRR